MALLNLIKTRSIKCRSIIDASRINRYSIRGTRGKFGTRSIKIWISYYCIRDIVKCETRSIKCRSIIIALRINYYCSERPDARKPWHTSLQTVWSNQLNGSMHTSSIRLVRLYLSYRLVRTIAESIVRQFVQSQLDEGTEPPAGQFLLSLGEEGGGEEGLNKLI